MSPDPRPVSVDIQETENNRPLIEAIQQDNPELEVTQFPGVVKLRAPERLEVNRETVEALQGSPWETGEFQMAIVTLSGNVSEWDEDQIVISWGHPVDDDDDDDDYDED